MFASLPSLERIGDCYWESKSGARGVYEPYLIEIAYLRMPEPDAGSQSG
jgi:hypothetical protein